MSPNLEPNWIRILVALIQPLARFCLRHSVSHKEFSEAAKRAFLEVAREELQAADREPNVSRLSVRTGIYRDEVSRLVKNRKSMEITQSNFTARILATWRTDARYVSGDGEPRELSYRGRNSEFWELAHSISKNLNPSTVASELIRLNIAIPGESGLKLLRSMQTYQGDPERGFSLVSRDLNALLAAAEENILERPKLSNVHIHTEYDNIDHSALSQIRHWVMEQSREFHKQAREFLSQFDRDINPQIPAGEGARVVIGSFSLTPKLPVESAPGPVEAEKSEEEAD